jgi:hypothetical protein
VQPLVLSPKVWMWKPRLALASLPVMSQEMVVGADSDSCTRVTVPETLESPRTTATVGGGGEPGQREVQIGLRSEGSTRGGLQGCCNREVWPSGSLSTFLKAHQGAPMGWQLSAPLTLSG